MNNDNIDEEIRKLIIDAIKSYTDGKAERKDLTEKRDYTEIGKIISQTDTSHYLVEINNAQVNISAKDYNIQTYQANDIVWVTIPKENYSNKFISGLKFRPV